MFGKSKTQKFGFRHTSRVVRDMRGTFVASCSCGFTATSADYTTAFNKAGTHVRNANRR
ncbi:hypothetical protein DWB77_02253 [Streptomyces hundungensis]|uniref:Uncharacterized protein n=1 Tax=Streptomyces hundungensis TaxID=1077946 RepID=A0A387HHN3_9ACTN|nr:hypothetical protein [Streptomyces hundungensis]AYG80127.1 hypothetical protein DWB77_02253 [Streptomyces hundungensis]